MIYKILKDCSGCPDGIHNKAYKEGETYRISPDLGSVFVKEGFAELVEEKPKAEEKPKKKKAAPKKKKHVKKEKKIVKFEGEE